MTTVAHVIAPAAFGGLETVVEALVIGQRERGWRVLIVAVLEPSLPVPPWLLALSSIGTIVEVVRSRSREVLRERELVRAALVKHAVELVHAHGIRADLIDASVARSLGIAVVSTAHGFVRNGVKQRLRAWIHLWSLRRATAVVAVSPPLFQELLRSGVRQSRLHLIANGWPGQARDARPKAEARSVLRLPATSRVVGWIGRLSHEKGPDIAIEAIERMLDPEAILCIVGDGPALKPLRDRCELAGIAHRVHFAGLVPNAASLVRAFDCLMLSSRSEGTPMVLLESARQSVPIVATAVGGVPELLGVQYPWLVRSEDSTELARAVERVLANPEKSAAVAEDLRRNIDARQSAADWVGSYLSVYLTAIRDHAAELRASG